MPFAVAKQALEAELNADNNFDFIEIDLFGGEPFMAFSTMRSVVDFLRNGSFAKKWSVSTITNGTLLTSEMKAWLASNSDVLDCVISYDGTPYMQRINRGKSTPEQIDLPFFKNTFPNTPVKMTISAETLPHLAEGTVYLHEHGFLVNNSLANGIDWHDQTSLEALANQLMQLVEYYMANPSVPECGMLQFPYEDLFAANLAGVTYRPCDACSKMTCYDVDGMPYPCQQFLPISIGSNRAAEVASIEFPPDVVPASCLDDECQRCQLSSVCQFCYGTRIHLQSRSRPMCHAEGALPGQGLSRGKQMGCWHAGTVR